MRSQHDDQVRELRREFEDKRQKLRDEYREKVSYAGRGRLDGQLSTGFFLN